MSLIRTPQRELTEDKKRGIHSKMKCDRGGRERDDLPLRSKMSPGHNSAEQDDVPLSCLTPWKPAPHGSRARP